MSTSSRRAFGNVSNVKSSHIDIERNKLTSLKVSQVDQDHDLKAGKSELKSSGKKKSSVSSEKKSKERKNIDLKKLIQPEADKGEYFLVFRSSKFIARIYSFLTFSLILLLSRLCHWCRSSWYLGRNRWMSSNSPFRNRGARFLPSLWDLWPYSTTRWDHDSWA